MGTGVLEGVIFFCEIWRHKTSLELALRATPKGLVCLGTRHACTRRRVWSITKRKSIMTYQVPSGLQVTATRAKSAKGELAQLKPKLDGKHALPLPERDLIPIPRDEQGWGSEFSMDAYGLAMVARRERSVQSIDHHNLGLVPADGDDVAQLAVVQAMAIKAVAELIQLDLDDTEARVRARAIAVATLDPVTDEELLAELAELKAPRYEFTSSGAFRKTGYQRTTAEVEAMIANKLQGDDLARFTKAMAKVTVTNGEVLRERYHVHKQLNAEAMRMVRGQDKFGKWVDADLASVADQAQSIFDTHTVEETPEEARRAKLAIALGKNTKRGQAGTQGLLMLLELTGLKLKTKDGAVQYHKDGRAKLTSTAPKSIATLEAEHGWDFFQKAKRDASTFMAQVA